MRTSWPFLVWGFLCSVFCLLLIHSLKLLNFIIGDWCQNSLPCLSLSMPRCHKLSWYPVPDSRTSRHVAENFQNSLFFQSWWYNAWLCTLFLFFKVLCSFPFWWFVCSYIGPDCTCNWQFCGWSGGWHLCGQKETSYGCSILLRLTAAQRCSRPWHLTHGKLASSFWR